MTLSSPRSKAPSIMILEQERWLSTAIDLPDTNMSG